MRGRPERLERLPDQYFGVLLGRVSAAAALECEPLIDLGRGNPETGPPAHVIEALTRSAERPDVHGYSPFRGLPELRSALAERYRDVYGVPLDPDAGWAPDFSSAPTEDVAAVYLNYPSNPCAVAVPDGAFESAIEYARANGAAVVHDFAYGDLVFDGREPRSFLATPGAKEVGVELFSMSKSYGMAGRAAARATRARWRACRSGSGVRTPV